MQIRANASEFFIFDLPRAAATGGRRVTVVFCPNGQLVVQRLLDRLKKHFAEGIPPDCIMLLGGQHAAAALTNAAEHPDIVRNVPAITRYVDRPPVLPVAFDRHGVLAPLTDHGRIVATQAVRALVVAIGLSAIFFERHGVLEAGAGFHYIKPSGRHTDRFIRTGNVLLYGSEVSFIAFALLPFVPEGVRRIYTDTASINSVAHTLIALRSALDADASTPMIDSFSSYPGLGRLDLEDADESLCLISASTSGSLELEIERKNRIPRPRMVTLYYCGPPVEGSRILCNLTQSLDNPDGMKVIESFEASECPHCRRGFTAVRISGDQFLPTDPKVIGLLVTAKHAPTWLADTMLSLVGKAVIRAHHDRSGSTGGTRQIYLHTADLIAGCRTGPETPFTWRIRGLLARSTPAALAAIIHLDDPSSLALARVAAAGHAEATKSAFDDAKIVSASRLTNHPAEVKAAISLAAGVVLVVASTVVAGRSVLAVSQALRQVAPERPLVYLVGIARTGTKKGWSELTSNLGYGKYAAEHPVQAVQVLHVPDDSSGATTPWDEERAFWQEILHDGDFAASVAPVRDFLDERVGAIDRAEGDEVLGLQDDLFLPRVCGGAIVSGPQARLSLRPGFAFWTFEYANSTQAEVYFTVASILHGLREGGAQDESLTQHEHVRTVLAPGCFSRFNDGVVQAAFLRAATRAELDYSHDERLSAQMKEVLLIVLRDVAQEACEAAPEFLLALAQGTLRLHANHAPDIQGALGQAQLPPLMGLLLRRWKEKPR